ncbi:hypothetical protein NIES4071_09800 [Calothrix sp. NIES-4071]|nr:hypothetical protein NIES4071_09800 [Calothrix sp. NIES-4071]BAZ55322.1 hypothetical protein NIES4105_09760 [Calothrix sp. NIES-4105]
MVLDFNIKVRLNDSIYSDFGFYPSKYTKIEVTPPQDTIAKLEADIANLEIMSNQLVQTKKQNQQLTLESKIEFGVQELEQIAEKINQLAAQLETEMHNFKSVAVEVNKHYHQQQLQSNNHDISKYNRRIPLNIWDIHFSSLPTIIKRGTKFIIVEKVIKLFK